MELYSEVIEVELDETRSPQAPRAFVCRGVRHEVVEVLTIWADAGFADRGRRKHQWWERRKRNYFRVRTAKGDRWELYLDRGGRRRQWFAARRWGAEEQGW